MISARQNKSDPNNESSSSSSEIDSDLSEPKSYAISKSKKRHQKHFFPTPQPITLRKEFTEIVQEKLQKRRAQNASICDKKKFSFNSVSSLSPAGLTEYWSDKQQSQAQIENKKVDVGKTHPVLPAQNAPFPLKQFSSFNSQTSPNPHNTTANLNSNAPDLPTPHSQKSPQSQLSSTFVTPIPLSTDIITPPNHLNFAQSMSPLEKKDEQKQADQEKVELDSQTNLRKGDFIQQNMANIEDLEEEKEIGDELLIKQQESIFKKNCPFLPLNFNRNIAGEHQSIQNEIEDENGSQFEFTPFWNGNTRSFSIKKQASQIQSTQKLQENIKEDIENENQIRDDGAVSIPLGSDRNHVEGQKHQTEQEQEEESPTRKAKIDSNIALFEPIESYLSPELHNDSTNCLQNTVSHVADASSPKFGQKQKSLIQQKETFQTIKPQIQESICQLYSTSLELTGDNKKDLVKTSSKQVSLENPSKKSNKKKSASRNSALRDKFDKNETNSSNSVISQQSKRKKKSTSPIQIFKSPIIVQRCKIQFKDQQRKQEQPNTDKKEKPRNQKESFYLDSQSRENMRQKRDFLVRSASKKRDQIFRRSKERSNQESTPTPPPKTRINQKSPLVNPLSSGEQGTLSGSFELENTVQLGIKNKDFSLTNNKSRKLRSRVVLNEYLQEFDSKSEGKEQESSQKFRLPSNEKKSLEECQSTLAHRKIQQKIKDNGISILELHSNQTSLSSQTNDSCPDDFQTSQSSKIDIFQFQSSNQKTRIFENDSRDSLQEILRLESERNRLNRSFELMLKEDRAQDKKSVIGNILLDQNQSKKFRKQGKSQQRSNLVQIQKNQNSSNKGSDGLDKNNIAPQQYSPQPELIVQKVKEQIRKQTSQQRQPTGNTINESQIANKKLLRFHSSLTQNSPSPNTYHHYDLTLDQSFPKPQNQKRNSALFQYPDQAHKMRIHDLVQAISFKKKADDFLEMQQSQPIQLTSTTIKFAEKPVNQQPVILRKSRAKNSQQKVVKNQQKQDSFKLPKVSLSVTETSDT